MNKVLNAAVLFGGALAAAGAAWAGPNGTVAGADLPVVPGTGGLLLKLGLSLAAVVGLILLLQRLARRWGGSLGRGASSEKIQILSTRALGPRTSLAVVQVMGRTLLVGISPQGIRPVADLGDAPAASRQEEPAAARVPAAARPRPEFSLKPAAFEGELSRRLAALRERYHTVAETQAQFQGGSR
jgi:flagellar protein FliO/FliZ